eukprot:TRINITY_DN28797_c0_g1_i1.p1 TRINITY_DN28797_c0_g1~~TRINITY_DN28797_c0_g1_i1.p1  ORF type:complete len:910 (-),score=171.11 TRINITY_DN28797_c0_g1_i1:13-2412(-)
MNKIFDSMDYFEFSPGEEITKQGERGHHFFVSHCGVFQQVVDGKVVGSKKAMTAFGGGATMYQCERTTSIVAEETTGVWAVPSQIFRQILKDGAGAARDENRQFLDGVTLFDGLNAQQKEAVASMELISEQVSAGQVVAVKGSPLTTLYIVKSGTLQRVSGGSISEDGTLEGGTPVTTLTTGRCFGERALFRGYLCHSLVAETDAELLGISIEKLHLAFGEDLGGTFLKLFVGSVLQQFPVAVHMAAYQRSQLLQTMEVRDLAAGVQVDSSVKLLVVVEGEASSGEVVLTRGDWCQDDSLSKLQEMRNAESCKPVQPCSLTASADGCKVAIATQEVLEKCCQYLEDWTGKEAFQFEQMSKMAALKAAPFCKHLSISQVNDLAARLKLLRFEKGAVVFDEGATGIDFYIIAQGHVEVSSSHTGSRSIYGSGACLGERGGLRWFLKEPRSTKAEVYTDNTELWSLNWDSFNEVIPEEVRDAIVQQMKLVEANVSLKDLKHVKVIGAGSFGSVRLVEHVGTGARYALKRVRKENGQVREDVRRECEIAMQVDHCYLLRSFDVLETRGSMYLLSELITGGTLFEEMNRSGVIGRKNARFFIGSLVLALEHLHEKLILYRDVKPENLMICSDGFVKLVDFGLSKRILAERPRTYSIVGTYFYMAPDVLLGEGYSTPADVWSVGVLLYELVCGTLPFGAEAPNDMEIARSILQDELKFPDRYNDSAGMKLMRGVLEKTPSQRLGACSWEDVKQQRYFKTGVPNESFFSKLLNREIPPPVVPADATDSPKERLDQITLSDAEELAP